MGGTTELQKTLGSKAYAISDYADPLKRVLTELQSATGKSLEQAAETSGQPELADELKSLRADYGDTINKLQDNNVIQAIRNKDLDGVAKLLMSRNTVGDNVSTLRGLLDRVGSRNMEGVENEIYQQLLDKSSDVSSGHRVVDFDKLASNFFQIPSEVRQQIWRSKLVGLDDLIRETQRGTNYFQDAAELAKYRAANAKEVAAETKKLFPVLTHYGAPGGLVAKAVWDGLNGDTDKAYKDLKYAAASFVGIQGLKVPGVQKAILSTLEFLSHASETRPLKGEISLSGNSVSPTINPDDLDEPELRPKTAGQLSQALEGQTPTHRYNPDTKTIEEIGSTEPESPKGSAVKSALGKTSPGFRGLGGK